LNDQRETAHAARGSSRLLRLLLAIVNVGGWLAPPSRRREWRRQWRADILHEWQWMARHQDGSTRAARLLVRAGGALRHAFWLRLHVRSLEMITQDIRYGWRLMVRKPLFTLVAVLTLGLGIGANVTVYSWAESWLRHPLTGVADFDRMVTLYGTNQTRANLPLSYLDFVDYRAQRPDSVDDLIASAHVTLSMRTDADPVRVWGQIVSGNYFTMLGVRVARGRGFSPEDDRVPDRDPVVVVSHDFWQRRFAGDPGLVGRSIVLNNHAFTVIGITAEGFHGNEWPLAFDLWVPMMMKQTVMGGEPLSARGISWLQVMVKLKPRAVLARAQSDFDVVARTLAAAYRQDTGRGVRVYPTWRSPGAAEVTLPMLGVLGGLVGVVLLIACANVASLLLARATTRQRETAVRLALGAGRRRLVQQMLTESALLAAAGGGVGILIAYWSINVTERFVPPTPYPVLIHTSLDAPTLLFALGVSAISALAFGLAPALQGSAASVVTALKAASGTVSSSPGRARFRQALVAGQVAASLVLLVSASLFVRTLRNAQAADPGFSTRSGLLASIDLAPAGYDDARGRVFYRDLLARVRDIPGVEAASIGGRVPLDFGWSGSVRAQIDGYTPLANEEIELYFNRVGSDYLRTMGIGLVDGREFTDRDTDGSLEVTVVSEAVVRRYFAGRSPIGGRIRIGPRPVQIVGVARDAKDSSINETPRPYLYLPAQQWHRPATVLTVKTAREPGSVVAAVQHTVKQLDPSVPIFDIRTIEDHLQIVSFVQRQLATMLGVFGALALLMATIGLYGVIASTVSQRTAEIGMRMALGAGRLDILALVLKQGMAVTLTGTAFGLVGAAAITRLFKSQLVGVSATDAVSFTGTTAMLVLVALAATYLPARRAASIDPLLALRQD
jgi:putative ABC transport system permease protein